MPLVKQSQWKKNLESIEAELLKRGQEKNAPDILKQFSSRLSPIIKQLFSKSSSFSPENYLSVEQLAFTHSLQLYNIKSVMRLAANYDANKGIKVVLPGIEKSYRSLMVIPQLKPFTKNAKEFSALDHYKFQLEKSLSEVLDCHVEELYEEDIMAEKMIVVSTATESVKKKFFSKRLSTLFSSNYRVYLMLKNRYFLHRIKCSGNNYGYKESQNSRFPEIISKFEENHGKTFLEFKENTDFRVVEKLVKELISKSTEKSKVESESIGNTIEDNTQNKNLYKYTQTNQTESSPLLGFSKTKEESNFSLETVIHDNSEEKDSAFEKLCETYSGPLKKLSSSIGPVPECSSPYFRSRVEEYCEEFANYFRKLHGEDMQVNAAVHNFTLELLTQRGNEYHAAERWGVIPKNNHQNKSIYFRSSENGTTVLDRKAEWNMLMHARMPFMFNFPLEKTKGFDIAKDKLFIFHIGTAFFDQNHQDKLDQYPDVFYKLMFGGDLLTSKNAIVYADEEPYFTTTLEQMWHCRGLVYLLLIAMSQRFTIEMSSTMQDFLVEVLPETLQANGLITSIESFPEVYNLKEVI